MLKNLAVVVLAFATAATPSFASKPSLGKPAQAAAAPILSRSARRGLAFAQYRCAVCHAVTQNRTSPNPESPPFADIANRPGVTAETLGQFLRDSHNFPAAMNFKVDASRITDLAKYIVTMQKAGYRPEI